VEDTTKQCNESALIIFIIDEIDIYI